MEKPQQEKPNQNQKTISRVVWDCGSELYDSFELKSFQHQLDSAITSRTLSMPHLPNHRARPPPPAKPTTTKKPSKFSRSFHKLLKSIFGPKQIAGPWYKAQGEAKDKFYVLYDLSGALSTIPEGPESGLDHSGFSPNLKSMVGRSASDRFRPTSIGISCP
ncbi:Coiled-coil domain-containing protein [Actinidia chinensis var. chinensis]|uniref:Coiled-coil domain-containing protein n=1 Tax=Actinidia chinensis var. chinensis TaxID=1590841 RepID=A0A2R6QN54_ACTCC|nr:Coiled-coil domain-containing protein [Actinidia chinensis var. chinensis]